MFEIDDKLTENIIYRDGKLLIFVSENNQITIKNGDAIIVLETILNDNISISSINGLLFSVSENKCCFVK